MPLWPIMKETRLVRWAMLGRVPVSLLAFRFRMLRVVRWNQAAGMLPRKLLDDRRTALMFSMAAKPAGSGPTMAFTGVHGRRSVFAARLGCCS